MNRKIQLAFIFCLTAFMVNCQSPMEVTRKSTHQFPQIKTKTLAGNQMVFPNDLKGKKSFVAMVFEEGGVYMPPQNQANKWADFYESAMREKGVNFYEIPMMAGGYVLGSWWIDAGMRSGIDPAQHDNVACFYGNKGKYMKMLNLKSMADAHMFLLDENGDILAQVSGNPDLSKKQVFLDALK
ncbi:MAG: hypothetical protein AAFY71_26190 [Bacteroidota bacterium]